MHFTKPFQRLAMMLLPTLVLCFALMGAAPAQVFPESLPLPNGFQPEGIAVGEGTTFYVGSIPTGAVYRGDLKTGTGAILVQAQADRNAIGMKYDDRTGLLYVAGGPSGHAFIYNGETGANVADIPLAASPTFVNDVVITQRAVYFTDSFQPVLYKIALGEDGALPSPPTGEIIQLGGEYNFIPNAFNANGIAATSNGKTLIIVNSAGGVLYNVNPDNGNATLIALGSGAVPNGDGILLQGLTLFVVQNALNKVAVVDLDSNLTSGQIVKTISSPLFRVPTTIAAFGDALYAVNARFGTPPEPDTAYEVVRIAVK